VKRQVRNDDNAPGQDSFLDVVANLVGILIILVMIVGVRARDALRQANDEPRPAPAEVDVGTPRNTAAALRGEVDSLVGRTRKQHVEILYRRSERDELLTRITAVENAMDSHRNTLSDEQRDAHQLQLQVAAARQEADELKMSLNAVEHAAAPVQVLEHRPTPLAKTVFGREIHFRLKDGRLAFVPVDELVERFKDEAREKAWKLRQAPEITETVGPIGDFRLQYTLKRESYAMETRVGTAYQERVELDHFVLIPVRDDLGEPVDRVLAADSDFRALLAGYDPQQSTVTIWVYPECFREFRLLKEELQKLGFLAAARPMPEGQLISGSPNGTRSAVQ